MKNLRKRSSRLPSISQRVLLAAGILVVVRSARADEQLLASFDDLNGWSIVTAPGAQARLSQDIGVHGQAARLDFDFSRGGGFILLHKAIAHPLSGQFRFRFLARQVGVANPLEFRLLDESLRNVWRARETATSVLGKTWHLMEVKKHHMEFAWGPVVGAQPTSIGSIEFALIYRNGGRGTLWLDELQLVSSESANVSTLPPSATANSSLVGHGPERALDGDSRTEWRSGAQGERQWFMLDLASQQDLGGLIIDWDEDDFGRDYDVELSDDGQTWRNAFRVRRGNGRRDLIPLPDAECRFVRLGLRQSSRARGYAIRRISAEPYAFSATRNAFLQAVGAGAPRGSYPRYWLGEQVYWTTVGTGGSDAAGDGAIGLLSEDGIFEARKEGVSIEPFLLAQGRINSWHNARSSVALKERYLPLPRVNLRYSQARLQVSVVASNTGQGSTARLRYLLRNTSTSSQVMTLILAVRPFQVLPPWQSVNMNAGAAPIFSAAVAGGRVLVNGEAAIALLSRPSSTSAVAFSQGHLTELLGQGVLAARTQLRDPSGYGTMLLQYRIKLAPQQARAIYLATPLRSKAGLAGASSASAWHALEAQAAGVWRQRLNRVKLVLPREFAGLVRTQKTALSHILLSRSGAVLRPGSRTYARAWIRDGALMSAALLQFGHARAVREFILWYAHAQQSDGHIPCCLDPWGPDAMIEHDAEGQFIYTVVEYFRYTQDQALLRALWPSIERAASYIESLRQQRLTPYYEQPATRLFYGLLPESASHEGYAAHPVHAYWDDFWALRGLKDAALAARAVGAGERASHYDRLLNEFRKDLLASIALSQRRHDIDYLPGAAELGDFDPSALAVALTPIDELAALPARDLEVSFARFLAERAKPREVYSPYEMRVVPALVLLEQPTQAVALMERLMQDRRPAEWHQWPEVAWRDYRMPRFIGDLPHAWISAEYLRALRSLFAYEDEQHDSLVLSAGLPKTWLLRGETIGVRKLPTHFGIIDYSIRRVDEHHIVALIAGKWSRKPSRVVLKLNLDQPLRQVWVDDVAQGPQVSDKVEIRRLPTRIKVDF